MCRLPYDLSVIFAVLLGFIAVLSEYFGHLVTSTFLLSKFRGFPRSSPVSFPAMRRRKCLGMKRSSQPSSTTPAKRAAKT